MLVYITTYANPKTTNATTRKSTLLKNSPFLLSLLLCGLNAECIVDIVAIDRDGGIVGIDIDEDIITETKSK